VCVIFHPDKSGRDCAPLENDTCRDELDLDQRDSRQAKGTYGSLSGPINPRPATGLGDLRQHSAQRGGWDIPEQSLTPVRARRLSPAGFPFGFGGRAELLTLLFMLALLGRGFWRLPRKSGGPPLFAPSLKLQGDDTHNNSGFSVI
jgi:hypothetical protein